MAVRLFKSIRHLHPHAALHYHSIGCDPHELDRMRKLDVEITEYPKNYGLLGAKPNLRFMCAHWRLFMLPRVMMATDRPVMWLDSDSLVVHSLDKFAADADNYDLAITVRRKARVRTRVMSGVYLVNNTTAGEEYLELCSELYKPNLQRFKWYADQATLGHGLKKVNMRLWELNSKLYCARRNEPKAYIWSFSRNKHKLGAWKAMSKRVEAYFPGV